MILQSGAYISQTDGKSTVWYGLYKTARSQHIYLSCNEKGRPRITSAERVRYLQETRK